MSCFKKIQEAVNKWITQFEEEYWPPLSMLAAVIEEVGEVAREINNLEGFKPKKCTEKEGKLGEELADLIFSIVCIANYYKIDLDEEFERIMKKYNNRDLNRWTLKNR
ncbi:MAG: nucleotide pyrophosphohydrolase [Candidatus Odinarchaeia archaeon]